MGDKNKDEESRLPSEASYTHKREGDYLREQPTVDCFRPGTAVHIKSLSEWGLGMVIDSSKDGMCQIHWQRLDMLKWHDVRTLLYFICKCTEKEKGTEEELKEKSFIVLPK